MRIVLVMHSPLGDAFSHCAGHVLGAAQPLVVFDIDSTDDPQEKTAALVEFILQAPDDPVLILCDVYGATPFNIANQAVSQANQQGGDAHLITGTNLCMVLKALTEHQENPDKLLENIRQGAMRGIVDTCHNC